MMQYAAIIKYAGVAPPAVRSDECQVAVLRFIDWRKKLFVLVGDRVYPHPSMVFKEASDECPAVRKL